MARRLLIALAVILVALFLSSSASTQTVVSRTRVQNLMEGSAYISTGPLSGNIAVLDAYDVFVFPQQKPRKGPAATRLFSLKGLSIVGHPNGVAYIPQERLFVFTEGLSPDKLFLSDASGRPQGVVTIKYLNGWMPNHVEGIAYIPPTAPIYPDHFVTAAVRMPTSTDPPGSVYDPRIEVIARDGTVDLEILPQPLSWMPDWGGSFLGGIEYLPGGTLLSGLDNNLVEYDFTGVPIRVQSFDTGWFEGVTRLPNNNFAVVGYQLGMLTFLDSNLQRTPALDRSNLFGPGLSDFEGVAYNPDTSQYLLHLFYAPISGTFDPGIYVLPPSLVSAGQLFGIPFASDWGQYRHMVYMPDDHLLAVLYRQNNSEGVPPHPEIRLYDNFGNLVQVIHLNQSPPDKYFPPYLSRGAVPGQLTYIPSLRQFVIRQGNPDGTPTPYAIFVSRDGIPLRTLDLTAAGFANGFGLVVHFNDGGVDKLLLQSGRNRIAVTGLGGVLLQEFDPRPTLGILSPTYTSIGATPGTFVTMDGGEFIVFRLTSTTPKKKNK
jgi:hypothetical protein